MTKEEALAHYMAETARLRAAIAKIDGLNDSPACFNADIDKITSAILRPDSKD